jgi:histidinol phosphatase-like PHP family hydrolase
MTVTGSLWRPVDCHAHSTFSDGELTVADVVSRAEAQGVRPSISDHIASYMANALQSVAEVRQYLDELDNHRTLRGGEFCWHDSLWRELPEELIPRFTHRIGSLHAIVLSRGELVYAFSRRFPIDLTPDEYMEEHVASLERFAREMPVDILAHPTLVPVALRAYPLEDLWTEELELRAVRSLAAAGIAFEVSNRYRAHERFVRRAWESGVRLSLGSDGHAFAQVADLSYPLALTRKLGVPDEELYDPARHGSRTGFYSRRSAA